MAAGSGSTHASRKQEGPLKFSARMATENIPNAFAPWFVGEVERSDKQLVRFLQQSG